MMRWRSELSYDIFYDVFELVWAIILSSLKYLVTTVMISDFKIHFIQKNAAEGGEKMRLFCLFLA